jgi:hypothetical protein
LGLALGASAGAWFERLRLRSILRSRIGSHDISGAERWREIAAALLAAVPALGAGSALHGAHPSLRASGVVVIYLAGYLAAGVAFGLPGLRQLFDRIRRRS